MTPAKMREFETGSEKGKPEHVKRDMTGRKETPAMERHDSPAHEKAESKVRERGEHLGWDHEQPKTPSSRGRTDSHPGMKYR